MSITGKSTRSSPLVGEIYVLRISMASLFSTESNFDSTPENLSKSSSTSSKQSEDRLKKSEGRPKPRPAVVWKTSPSIQVLIMSKFDDADVSDPNVRLFNHLSFEYVLKRLIAVAPKAPYGGRGSISAATKIINTEMKTVNTNLILIPTIVEENCKWKTIHEYFPPEQLQYVNEILFQIAIEELKKKHEEQSKFIQTISYGQNK